MNYITIRDVNINDHYDWQYLYKQYLDFYNKSLSDEQLLSLWKIIVENKYDVYCYLATYNDKVIGLAHFRKFFNPIRANMELFNEDIISIQDIKS